MELAHLRWFQQVADGVTVTEISDLDGVSQSGVSRALARLETEIGVPLLRRSGRVLRMTRAGAAFKHYVDRSLATLDDGFAVLAELASPDSGTVSVVFQPSLGGWLVPELVAGFRVDHPKVSFELRQVPDAASGQAVLAGDADVEITTIDAGLPGLRWRALTAEPLYLAVAERHPLAGRASVGLAQVSHSPFVMLRPEFALRGTCELLCADAGFRPAIAFQADDLATLGGFVAAGLGVAIVPRPAGATGGVAYLGIEQPAASRTIGVAWAAERRLAPAGDRFRRYVVDRMRGVPLPSGPRTPQFGVSDVAQ